MKWYWCSNKHRHLAVLIVFISAILLSTMKSVHTAFVASRHISAGIVIGSDGRGHSKEKGVLVDVNAAKDLYKLTEMSYIACIASPSEFECLLNDVRALLSGMRAHGRVKGESLSTESLARVVQKMGRDLYPNVHVILLGYSYEVNKYQLFEVLPTGTLVEQEYVCAGGGSDCILGLLESQFWSKHGDSHEGKSEDKSMHKYMNDDDDDDDGELLERREKIVRHAVRISMMSDHRSGGKMNLLRFTKEEGLINL